jgi:hypothetical protein
MDAGLTDCALFTSALYSLNERLDPRQPAQIVEFIDQFKKKRGPQIDRNETAADKATPLRKGEVSAAAAGAGSSKKRNLVLSKS